MTVELIHADGVRDALVPLLVATPCVLGAWHYGSSLRTDYRPGCSDVDVLLVLDDSTAVDEYLRVCDAVRLRVPRAEVTVMRLAEVDAGIHPGWSRHFFFNVSRSGRRLYGPDLLARATLQPLNFDEAYQRLVELTQRARLVSVNPSKQHEAPFWLAKYQHWVPLVLMELLELAGAPEDRLQLAHAVFTARFTTLRRQVPFPYPDLSALGEFLEELVRWVPAQAETFGAAPAIGRPA